MSKQLVGHHLMRVRIRKNIFDLMQDIAEEETDRSGEHVTVSDIVRAACYNYLLIHESVRRLEAAHLMALNDMEEDEEDEEEEDEDEMVYIITRPML
jgi:hypothetical protein